MIGPQARLVVYAVAVTAAHVELFGSALAGVWHPPLYWVAVGSIIPLGLFGIRRIYHAHATDYSDKVTSYGPANQEKIDRLESGWSGKWVQ